MRRAFWGWLGVFWLFTGSISQAQNAPPGDPAYAGLLEAGAGVLNNKRLSTAQLEKSLTLATRRAVLKEPEIQETLRKTRLWLDKPLEPAQPLSLKNESASIRLYHIARQIGVVFAYQIHIHFAEGRIREGLDTARDAFRLAYALEAYSLSGWLMGTAIEQITVNALAPLLDQLSAKACSQALQLAKDLAKATKPLGVAAERERMANLALVKQGQAEFGSAAAQKALSERIDTLFKAFEQAQAEPYGARREAGLYIKESDATLGDSLLSSLAPALLITLDNQMRRLAVARLLGCHAAIRRFRWENQRLPISLEELELGELALDPFTEQEFAYKVAQNGFTLESAGFFERNADHTRNTARRRPFSLTGSLATGVQ